MYRSHGGNHQGHTTHGDAPNVLTAANPLTPVRRVTQLGAYGEQPEQDPRSGHREARGVDHPALAGLQLGAGALLVIPGELIVSCFEAARDFVVFTDKRLIAVNVQGMTGKKRDVTSLPLDSRATLTSASFGT